MGGVATALVSLYGSSAPRSHAMPSPGLTAPSRPKRLLSARITEQQYAALHRLAGALNAAPSALARHALARGLELLEAEHLPAQQ